MSLRVESTRGELVESVHPVAAAVVSAGGDLLAHAGDADLVTFWRSSAKPFQAIPVVADGAADRFDLDDEHLALACASHSSERLHLDLTDAFLARIGCREEDLACGPHPPLGPAGVESSPRGVQPTPRWSNCSGKHAAMLALARHGGWPTEGYVATDHPVQRRIAAEVGRWTGLDGDGLAMAVDGCAAPSFALPLRAMALAYARLGVSDEPAAARVRAAMMAHPQIVAGTGRLCTDLMAVCAGQVVAKVGAEGVYCAAVPAGGYGIALKVTSGDMRSAAVALVEVLRQLSARRAPALSLDGLAKHAARPILNTRQQRTGELRPAGALQFSDAVGG